MNYLYFIQLKLSFKLQSHLKIIFIVLFSTGRDSEITFTDYF